jgi:hypothetical protein
MRAPALPFLLAVVLLAACEQDDKTSEPSEPTAAGSASAPKSKPAPPSAADVAKLTWKDESGSKTLAKTSLAKGCRLRGMSMVLPDDAAPKPLMGQRGCTIFAWGKDGPYMAVMSDAIAVKMSPKDEIKGVVRTVEENDDSWIIENDTSKKGVKKFSTRRTSKVDDRTYYCMGNADSPEVVRGMQQLCATLQPVGAKP